MQAGIANLPKTTFGAMLMHERERQGLSHRDVSVRVGVDRETVKKWEKNETIPNRLELKKLFGSMQRLRHYVNLLPTDIVNQVQFDARTSGDPLPQQLAPVAPPQPAPPQTFGEALRRARLREGLAQDEFGELLHVTGQAVSAWETEQNNPIADHYDAICELLPDLRSAPKPTLIRDIEKPYGGGRTAGGERGEDSERPVTIPETLFEDEDEFAYVNAPPKKEEPMGGLDMTKINQPIKPMPKLSTLSPEEQKKAMIRWGRLVLTLCHAPNAKQFTDFLAEANDCGMTLQEVIDALSEMKR